MLRERVAGDVEVERLLLELQLLGLGPLGHVRQAVVGARPRPCPSSSPPRRTCRGSSSARGGGRRPARRPPGTPWRRRRSAPPAGRSASNAPAMTIFSTAAFWHDAAVDPLAEVEEVLELPARRVRARTISSAAPRPSPLMAVRPKTMRLLCTSKSASPRLTSGGSTSTPSLRASAM